MKILKTTKQSSVVIKLRNPDDLNSKINHYARFSEDNWYKLVGTDLWRKVYDCQELEKIYQEWVKENIKE